MKVGAFQIGRYHAIIKKSYADRSADYETSFSDEADLMESVYCIKLCVGKMVGLATDTPKVLADVQVIRGKENIVRELEELRKFDQAGVAAFCNQHGLQKTMQEERRQSR